jgi:hypothetical protein
MGRIRRTEETRWAKYRVGSFPGAACCQPIELPHYKAAPLQGGGLTISLCSLGVRLGRRIYVLGSDTFASLIAFT